MSIAILQTHKRVEALLRRIYPSFRNFPKSETHGMCLLIKQSLVGLMSSLSMSAEVKSRRIAYLQESDAHLYSFRTLIKLSYDMRYISNGLFSEIDLIVSEIRSEIKSHFVRK